MEIDTEDDDMFFVKDCRGVRICEWESVDFKTFFDMLTGEAMWTEEWAGPNWRHLIECLRSFPLCGSRHMFMIAKSPEDLNAKMDAFMRR